MSRSVRWGRVWVLSALLFSAAFPFRPAHALCDGCVTAAVEKAALSINAVIGQMDAKLQFQLTNIGNAIASMNTGNVALLEKLSQVNQQGFKTLARESHELTSKVETLNIKRDINDYFGAISQDHCLEKELTSGVTDTRNDVFQATLLNTKAFSGEIKAATRSPALRRRILEQYLPEGVDFSTFLSAQSTLDSGALEHIPVLTHMLAQNTVFPNPPESNNDLGRQYKQLKREREAHASIVEDVIARSMLSQAPLLEAADYVSIALEQAQIDPGPFVQDGLTSEVGLVKALGLSNFGNESGVRLSAVSGEELIRVLISEVGKTNFVLAKQYELLSDLRHLNALSYGKHVELFYDDTLQTAYQGLN